MANYEDRLKREIDTYLWLIQKCHNVDVSSDKDFQRRYKGFYMPAPKPDVFCREYFKLMEKYKSAEITTDTVNNYFELIIKELAKRTASVEFSFVTKMLATINPKLPIWDKYVGEMLLIPRAPSEWRMSKRIEYSVNAYKRLLEWYSYPEVENYVILFDKKYPEHADKIGRVKKIDFMLWETGWI